MSGITKFGIFFIERCPAIVRFLQIGSVTARHHLWASMKFLDIFVWRPV